ncbi:hypothetical protein CBE90_04575 [Pasteurella multocida]|uniref:zincin-like metallopeptidase domain-containing protein n=1 Tax=Pasteurella multocida TaxID=747 RepID=UPI000CE80431|nr:zincin-like metallopeptidase domain-containing protein [Pasteurella multocida]PPE94917.1 hypothetical protein CBE90_04575 [Pasteurella multocida]PPE95037.1 hypothetical protein CBE91_10265 [Pasteurella multocida]
MNNEKKSITFNDLYGMQSKAFFELIMSTDQKWRKKWADEGFQQQNAESEKAYNNLNQTLLFSRAVSENMPDPRWLTFNQAKSADYKIKKGVKGSHIFRLVYGYDRIKKDENNKPILDQDGKNTMEFVKYDRPRIKVFTVFNARDIDGIKAFKPLEIPEKHKILMQKENYKNAEKMIEDFCKENNISLQEMASEQAFHQYNNGSSDKKVVVPLKSQFNNLDDYFSVLFHEVAHSTKHLGIRINTKTDTPHGNLFGSQNYAKEELTAELTALLLCKQFGIDSTATAEREQNSLAYLKSWINSGLLFEDDFHTATIEANRASKAIFEYAPKITLSMDEIIKENNYNNIILNNDNIITPKNIKNDFKQKISEIFDKADHLSLTHLNKIRQGKPFNDDNNFFNVKNEENLSQLPLYKKYIDLGYMEHIEKKENSNINVYQLTEKGINIINKHFENLLEKEKQKTGKPVTIKECNELLKRINDKHLTLTSGNEAEFKNKPYPEIMLPLLEEAQKILERPFNANSLAYKRNIEWDVKSIEKTIEKWDNAQSKTLLTSDGEEIFNIKLLWAEGKQIDTEPRSFGSNLDDLQKWFEKRFCNSIISKEQNPTLVGGYDKTKFEITYKTKESDELKTTEFRIDVGQKDFNPRTENIKDHLEKLWKCQFINHPTPKLSNEIKNELKKKQESAVKVKTGISIN